VKDIATVVAKQSPSINIGVIGFKLVVGGAICLKQKKVSTAKEV
jgi:hypothetical protein